MTSVKQNLYRLCYGVVAIVVGVVTAVIASSCTVDVEPTTAGDAAVQTTAADTNPAETEPSATATTTPASTPTPTPEEPEAEEPEAEEPEAEEPAIAPSAGSVGLGDAYFPDLGNGGYDVQAYTLTLDWDDDARTIAGETEIELVATQQLSQFNVELLGFDITAVTVNDNAATWQRDDDEVTIVPSDELADREVATVRITYEGKPSQIPSSLGIAEGWIDLGDGVIVAGEPRGAAGWFPVNEHPTDKALYTVVVTADDDLAVVSNGTLADSSSANGRTTWTYTNRDPMASYLLTLAIGDYERHDGRPSNSGIPVRHYFHTETFERAVATMERTGEMIDAFEAMFGPYPFESYGTVVANAPFGFALETQTLSVFGNDLLIDSLIGYEDIVAHELAHQWFGNHVSLGQWSDIWLNEGFASYSEFLWKDASQPDYDLDAEIRLEHSRYGEFLFVPPGAPPSNDLFNPSVYLRGAFTLHALRTTIGDDAFFGLTNVWLTEFGESHATTDDFIGLAEDVSGQDLAEFFEAWLFSSDIPEMPR